MAGIRSARKVQFGKETTPGTAVPATTILRVPEAVLEDAREIVFPEENIGLLVPTDRAITSNVFGKMEVNETEATFEQILYPLQSGLLKITSPTNDGSGSGKIWTFPFPTTSKPTLQTFTVEAGDDQQAERMAYAVTDSLKISGRPKETVKYSFTMFGRQVETTTFTASVAIPTVEDMIFQQSKLYIDNPPAPGTTEVSGTLMGFDLDLKFGWVPIFTGSGQLYFSEIGFQKFEGSLEVIFLHNGSAVSEKANWRNRVSRALQIKIEGSNLTTPGTTYQKKTFLINLFGKWEKFDVLGEEDGNSVVTGTFRVGYVSSAASAGSLVVVNELTSLP